MFIERYPIIRRFNRFIDCKRSLNRIVIAEELIFSLTEAIDEKTKIQLGMNQSRKNCFPLSGCPGVFASFSVLNCVEN